MLHQIVRSLREFLVSGIGILILGLALLVCCVKLSQAHEGAPGAKEVAATPAAQVEGLIKTLEDPKQREELLMKMKALQAVSHGVKPEVKKGTLDTLLAEITQKSMQLTEFFVAMAPALQKIPMQFVTFFEKFTSEHLKGVIGALILLGAAVAIGLLFEHALRLMFANLKKRSALSGAQSVVGMHAFLLTRLLAAVFPLCVFYMVSVAFVYGAIEMLGQVNVALLHDVSNQLFLAILHIIIAIFIFRMVRIVSYTLFAPQSANERYIKMDDARAHHLHYYIQGVVGFAVIGFAISNVTEVLGLELEPRVLWSRFVGLVTLLATLSLIFQYRNEVANWLRDEVGKNDSRSRVVRELLFFIADVWHILAAIIGVAIFFSWSVNPESGHENLMRASLLTGLVLLGVRLCHYIVVKAIHWVSRSQEKPGDKAHASPMPHLDSFLHLVIHVSGLILILQAWGIDIFALAKTPSGELFVGRVISLLVIVLVGLLVWELINKLISDQLRPLTIDGKVTEPSRRAQTLLPIVRNVVRWVIMLFTLVMVLAELGLNVVPLLAGLGVVGIAFSMGSQRLAQDIVTGVFILMENSLEVGDVVNVGGVNGEVVAFTIRTVVVRNISGELHTIPYSAIGSIGNLSRDYTNSIVEISVGHDANIPSVFDVLKAVGTEMKSDEDVKPKVLSDIVVLGVSKMTDTAIDIMIFMKTEPDPYHLVDQQFRHRVKLKFMELGIPFPGVRQVVSFQPSGKQASLRVALEGAK